MMKKLTVAKFIEGSYFPSFDGASSKFSNIPRFIQQVGVDMKIVHCYRGWSDLQLIRKLPFVTYAMPPSIFYGRPDILLQILARDEIDIIEFNDIETIISIGAFLSHKLNIPITYDVLIVSSELAKFISTNLDVIKTKALEKRSKGLISAATCLTSYDRYKFINTSLIDSNRVFVVPLGVDIDKIVFCGPAINSNIILFLGNLFYEPNARAVETIATVIYPMIEKVIPSAVFWIIGDVPIKLVKKYQRSNFQFEGRVKDKDLNKIFKHTKVALAPLDIGGGMRVKVLHYMAAGIPTILTSTAAEGIVDNNLIIEDNYSKYADKILGLFQNDSLSQKIGKALRKNTEEYYTWDRIANLLNEFYIFAKNNKVSVPYYESNKTVFKPPSWLKETISKGRFISKEALPDNFYLRLGNGEVKKFVA